MSLENDFCDSRLRSGAKIRMICFPYAGGNSSTYMPWVNELPESVDLLAVELPGRSHRFGEPAYRNMEDLIEDLFEAFQILTNKPYILMGHSLGSRVAFELMYRFKQQDLRMPEHFIASGSPAPHIKEKRKELYKLPSDEFKEELRKLNGTPEEVLENVELMKLAEPFIRADFELSETYTYCGNERFNCPISVFHGDKDTEISLSDAQAWEAHFVHSATMHIFPGDHFFIDKNRTNVLKKVNAIIEDALGNGA